MKTKLKVKVAHKQELILINARVIVTKETMNNGTFFFLIRNEIYIILMIIIAKVQEKVEKSFPQKTDFDQSNKTPLYTK